jgi:large subunit ribosomal protein L28
MAKVCQITGVGVTRGHHIHRSGKAKKEGGIGKHITKRVKRVIFPNLRTKRIWVPELAKFVTVKLTQTSSDLFGSRLGLCHLR